MVSHTITFMSMVDLWQSYYQKARGGGKDIPDVRATEDFIQRIPESEEVFNCLSPYGKSFLELVKGLSSDVTILEGIVKDVLCFFPKFFRVESISQLQSYTYVNLDKAIDQTHFLGLCSHLILCTHTHRHRIKLIDFNYLYNQFLKVSGEADVQMRSYDMDVNGITKAIFKEHFSLSVEPVLRRDLGVGFWKMGKLRSHFGNLFFTGSLLGMLADTQAEAG